MSNYIKATNFATKDTLTTGDPAKIIKGTEIDTEFNSIASAISSKADINNPAFTGTPAAPTASPGTNTTQLATTAFVLANQTPLTTILQTVYPVGSIYINATNSTNPGTLLGFGTWTAFGAGRVPVGFNASDPLFDSAEETGGSKDAIVVSHTHTATSTVTDPGHFHNGPTGDEFKAYGNSGIVANGPSGLRSSDTIGTTETKTTGITVSTTNTTTGSSGTNANLQPYITVYMWKRVA